MGWRARCADRLVSPDEAVQIVQDGDSVWLGGWTSMPATLARALGARAGKLRDVAVDTFLSPYQWDFPGREQSFTVRTFYAGPLDRAATAAARFEYVPLCQWREGEAPPGINSPHDVAMVPISPPDAEGWCSFGGAVWSFFALRAHGSEVWVTVTSVREARGRRARAVRSKQRRSRQRRPTDLHR